MKEYIAVHTRKMRQPLIVEAEQWRNAQRPPPIVEEFEVDAADKRAEVLTDNGLETMRVGDWVTRVVQPMAGQIGKGAKAKEVEHDDVGKVYVAEEARFARTFREHNRHTADTVFPGEHDAVDE